MFSDKYFKNAGRPLFIHSKRKKHSREGENGFLDNLLSNNALKRRAYGVEPTHRRSSQSGGN